MSCSDVMDAHVQGNGRIADQIIIRSDSDVSLRSDGGDGFRMEDVRPFRKLAISAKEVGEGIGIRDLVQVY